MSCRMWLLLGGFALAMAAGCDQAPAPQKTAMEQCRDMCAPRPVRHFYLNFSTQCECEASK